VVVVAPLDADVMVDPCVVLVDVPGARVVEVDDAVVDGGLEHAATVRATTSTAMATADRLVRRARSTPEAYVDDRSGARIRTPELLHANR
jgi:hypothetical protein